MFKLKDRDEAVAVVAAWRMAWRRDGITRAEPPEPRDPPCHTFLTFWPVRSRGGVLCAIVAREGTSGRRPVALSLRIIRQRYGRPGAFVGYRLNEGPWVAYDTSGSDHKGAKNSTCPMLRRRHSYVAAFKINAYCPVVVAGLAYGRRRQGLRMTQYRPRRGVRNVRCCVNVNKNSNLLSLFRDRPRSLWSFPASSVKLRCMHSNSLTPINFVEASSLGVN